MRALARYALAFDAGLLAGLALASAWREYRRFNPKENAR